MDLAKAFHDAATAAIGGLSLSGFVVAVGITMFGGILRVNILNEDQRSAGRGVCLYFVWPGIPVAGGAVFAVART